MRTIIRTLLLSAIFATSSLLNLSFADEDMAKFTLKIKPNQQNVEVKIDGDGHKQIQIRAEYVKLNTITNNYHIKVIITNNSGQMLYHQLALIYKVEHSEIKYPDSTTDYKNNKTIPYYNYGNIKPMQTTPREWYLSNTGKDEIKIQGYIISNKIPIILDPKIAATNSNVAQTLTTYVRALRDNDLYMLLSIIPNGWGYTKLKYEYIQVFMFNTSRVIQSSKFWERPSNIEISGDTCWIEYNYIDPDDGHTYPWVLVLVYDDTKWWIAR